MLSEAKLLEQNRALRERVDELEETVRQLLAEPPGLDPLPAGVPPLTPLEEKALRALLAVKGTVTHGTFYRAFYGTDTRVEEKIVSVIVCKLRRKLRESGSPIKIRTEWARGYSIVRNDAAYARGEVAQFVSEAVAA
jgi:DNA-binding response OmpR family regulator